ncbi:MAG: oligosaccharide flippase family protein [Bacteroidales bacterium]|nr:oligosaccharide flippase family protein [Bacteroidales bacterium]
MAQNVLSKILKNNNVLSLANNGLVAVFGFLGFLLLVRSLNTDDFGKWVLLITTANFIDMLRFGITRTAIVRFLAGADQNQSKKLIGSNYIINLISTGLIVGIILLANFLFYDQIQDSGFSLFFQWFPILAVITIPFNNAQSVLQAKLRFDYILVLRVINVGGFMIFLLINYFFTRYSLQTIVYAYIIINIITSVVSSVTNWDGILQIFSASRHTNKQILDFGKYTTGTLIGSNLLKSADTFIIGLSPFLGTAGVALYSIPMKLTEIIEIPLRSYTMTAFPGMSKASIEGDNEKVRQIFYTNAGGMTLILIPVMIFSFIFADDFVYILGGKGYESTASIFRIFCIYGMLLPLDRFIGVTLDSINLPKFNFYKVIYMTLANIIGDTLVVFAFLYVALSFSITSLIASGENLITIIQVSKDFTIYTVLQGVAWVTILFTLIGILVGYYYLNKKLNIQLRKIFSGGIQFIGQLNVWRKK